MRNAARKELEPTAPVCGDVQCAGPSTSPLTDPLADPLRDPLQAWGGSTDAGADPIQMEGENPAVQREEDAQRPPTCAPGTEDADPQSLSPEQRYRRRTSCFDHHRQQGLEQGGMKRLRDTVLRAVLGAATEVAPHSRITSLLAYYNGEKGITNAHMLIKTLYEEANVLVTGQKRDAGRPFPEIGPSTGQTGELGPKKRAAQTRAWIAIQVHAVMDSWFEDEIAAGVMARDPAFSEAKLAQSYVAHWRKAHAMYFSLAAVYYDAALTDYAKWGDYNETPPFMVKPKGLADIGVKGATSP